METNDQKYDEEKYLILRIPKDDIRDAASERLEGEFDDEVIEATTEKVMWSDADGDAYHLIVKFYTDLIVEVCVEDAEAAEATAGE